MNCRQVQHHLFATGDRELPAEVGSALAAHVVSCAECRQVQASLAGALESFRADVQGVRVPHAEFEWQKVRREIHRSPAKSYRSLATWIALPVAAAAAVAIGLYVAPGNDGADARERLAPAPTVAAAAEPPSTVVYVDDKSGWTFVWTADSGGNGQPI